jgi:hypothetical protein
MLSLQTATCPVELGAGDRVELVDANVRLTLPRVESRYGHFDVTREFGTKELA